MISTMAERDAIDLAGLESELGSKPSEHLRDRFFSCYAGAARLMAEAAVCVKLLKERGEDLKGVPMMGTFLRIASGQVDPDLAWKFIESPNRHRVERLPLDDQRRLAANTMVPVVERVNGSKFTTRMVDMITAPADVAKLVAGPDGIRDPEEQIAHMAAQKKTAATQIRPEINDEIADEPLAHRLTVRLTASELESVKIHAAVAHLSEAEMARRFLLRAEAFKRPKT